MLVLPRRFAYKRRVVRRWLIAFCRGMIRGGGRGSAKSMS
jgi:hypothetical protein